MMTRQDSIFELYYNFQKLFLSEKFMSSVYVMGCILCFVSYICVIGCSDLEVLRVAQKDCSLAQLPDLVLKKIAKFSCLSAVASMQCTCKLFNRVFAIAHIKLGQMADRQGEAGHTKYEKKFWEKIFNSLVKVIGTRHVTFGSVALDLSGNYVEQFMFARYKQCSSIKKLRLVSCRLTNERDNFFDPTIWTHLEKLDMSKNSLGICDKQLGGMTDWYSGAYIWHSLCSLPKLKKLILSENRLTVIPNELFEFKQLEYLDLRNNPLSTDEISLLKSKLPKTTIKC